MPRLSDTKIDEIIEAEFADALEALRDKQRDQIVAEVRAMFEREKPGQQAYFLPEFQAEVRVRLAADANDIDRSARWMLSADMEARRRELRAHGQ